MQHFGLVNQWLNSWFPTSDSEFALFLEDDNVVVAGFYEFMKQGILHYQFDPENYDPRVFGFNMQHQVRRAKHGEGERLRRGLGEEAGIGRDEEMAGGR